MLNKDKLKGFAVGMIFAVLLCSTVTFAESVERNLKAFYNGIKLVINGQEITPKDANGNIVEPFIVDGTTYLPVRAVASALNLPVDWDGNTNTVYLGEKPLNTTQKSDFTVDASTISSFSSTTLAKAGVVPIKGDAVNFFVAQNCTSDVLSAYSDNYSPDGTLQTIIIGEKTAAEFLSSDAINRLGSIYAFADKAKKSGFADKEEIKKAINENWDGFCNQFQSEAEYQNYLKVNFVTEDTLRNLLSSNQLATLYLENEIEKANNKNYSVNELYDYYTSEYVHVKHILVSDEATAKEVISKLNGGADFSSLVKEYGTDPGQGENGYVFTKNEMVKEFEDASFALKENTYTKEAVKTAYGYHIIYRYPIKKEYVSENFDEIKRAVITSTIDEFYTNTLKEYTISYTDEYNKYISTIK